MRLFLRKLQVSLGGVTCRFSNVIVLDPSLEAPNL